MTQHGFDKSIWRKSAQWIALNRKHAEIYANDTKLIAAMDSVRPLDEHYAATLLAYHGLDNETTCSDGFAHVDWRSLNDAHPVSFAPEDITPSLVHNLRTLPTMGVGSVFNARCSGIEEICHFTARKFTRDDRRELLDAMPLLLAPLHEENSTNARNGNGNTTSSKERERQRQAHSLSELVKKVVRQHVRLDPFANKHYYQVDWQLRLIPNNETLRLLYVDAHTKVSVLSKSELSELTIGPPFVDLAEPMPMKLHRQNAVWLAVNGTRHVFPNFPTYVSMGYGPFKTVSSADLGEFPIGPELPSLA